MSINQKPRARLFLTGRGLYTSRAASALFLRSRLDLVLAVLRRCSSLLAVAGRAGSSLLAGLAACRALPALPLLQTHRSNHKHNLRREKTGEKRGETSSLPGWCFA